MAESPLAARFPEDAASPARLRPAGSDPAGFPPPGGVGARNRRGMQATARLESPGMLQPTRLECKDDESAASGADPVGRQCEDPQKINSIKIDGA